ncbi:uncharacterized protein LOC133061956 isoform X1 [Dama dama]|uniref:uncharacterized protein LOC133061956 isoform X1 n=1 Tax=Dama dama TaxID=30532 RepID=UPI002A360FDC|nr:uncharacterized protein LOC133061956 isoform X1 [Dama dama]
MPGRRRTPQLLHPLVGSLEVLGFLLEYRTCWWCSSCQLPRVARMGMNSRAPRTGTDPSQTKDTSMALGCGAAGNSSRTRDLLPPSAVTAHMGFYPHQVSAEATDTEALGAETSPTIHQTRSQSCSSGWTKVFPPGLSRSLGPDSTPANPLGGDTSADHDDGSAAPQVDPPFLKGARQKRNFRNPGMKKPEEPPGPHKSEPGPEGSGVPQEPPVVTPTCGALLSPGWTCSSQLSLAGTYCAWQSSHQSSAGTTPEGVVLVQEHQYGHDLIHALEVAHLLQEPDVRGGPTRSPPLLLDASAPWPAMATWGPSLYYSAERSFCQWKPTPRMGKRGVPVTHSEERSLLVTLYTERSASSPGSSGDLAWPKSQRGREMQERQSRTTPASQGHSTRPA